MSATTVSALQLMYAPAKERTAAIADGGAGGGLGRRLWARGTRGSRWATASGSRAPGVRRRLRTRRRAAAPRRSSTPASQPLRMPGDEPIRAPDQRVPADSAASVPRPGGVVRVPAQPGHVHEHVVCVGVDRHPGTRSGLPEGLELARGSPSRSPAAARLRTAGARRSRSSRSRARPRSSGTPWPPPYTYGLPTIWLPAAMISLTAGGASAGAAASPSGSSCARGPGDHGTPPSVPARARRRIRGRRLRREQRARARRAPDPAGSPAPLAGGRSIRTGPDHRPFSYGIPSRPASCHHRSITRGRPSIGGPPEPDVALVGDRRVTRPGDPQRRHVRQPAHRGRGLEGRAAELGVAVGVLQQARAGRADRPRARVAGAAVLGRAHELLRCRGARARSSRPARRRTGCPRVNTLISSASSAAPSPPRQIPPTATAARAAP